MHNNLRRFAADYASAEERQVDQGDDQSSIHFPTVFLFIGAKVSDAIAPIIRINERKWDNNAGVMYAHVVSRDWTAASADHTQRTSGVYSGSSVASPLDDDIDHAEGSKQNSMQTRVTRLELPVHTMGKSRSQRKDVYTQFHQNEGHLLELNRMLRQISYSIAQYGRLYASFDRIHVAVITRVDDPLNVFVPEISLLAKAIFSQSFKSVQMDLYALISEKEQMESFGYDSSLGVAFLRELDYMQSARYSFHAPLQVTEDGISIPVVHTAAPLFDLAYLLSDKNERGISSAHDLEDNCEIICYMSLLKNRKLSDIPHEQQGERYNNTSFKNNIMTEDGRQGYVSAGFSKVKRPNESIALTVMYQLYRELLVRMKERPMPNSTEKLDVLGLTSSDVAIVMAGIVPDDHAIQDMSGIMTHELSYSQLKRMTLREAEQALFGEGCEAYFRNNFVQVAEQRMSQRSAAEQLHQHVQQTLSKHPDISLFQLYEWTNEANEAESVWRDLHGLIRDKTKVLESVRGELEQKYQERVEEQSFQRLPLMDKHNVRSFIRCFFDNVYRHKLEMLRVEMELAWYRQYETALAQFHATCARQVQVLKQVEHELHQAAISMINEADDYIGQNIMEYYQVVTAAVMQDMEAKRGEGSFFEDRLIGNLAQLAEAGEEALTDKLMAVCKQHILTAAPFHQTFEEELLRRANVTIDYSNREVLSKDELFKKLYRTLEEHAVIHIRLLDYTHEHRYEEKYFFGDRSSEFIRYALHTDETSRIYKLGCVHERRSSGVEKLNLMGGFHVEDMMYYRNGRVYYDSYAENGYEFHGIQPDLLPDIR
ncbi:transcription initiation factor TFIID [Paenibacillus taiwanensis]|uniref:transcription initiation factor TFIID n=1 Tax=Paenibacillus taiwanensis TaxID=401638 RepID=UPI0012F7FC4B|nr:transcription initiation factor TFIID [Paenibacillus taiwanensis]